MLYEIVVKNVGTGSKEFKAQLFFEKGDERALFAVIEEGLAKHYILCAGDKCHTLIRNDIAYHVCPVCAKRWSVS